MKRGLMILVLFFAFFLFVFSSVLVSALEIQLFKTSYLPYETFQAEVTGNFSSKISSENIFFSYAEKEIPVNFYLVKISSTQYFVYAELPSKIGNYSLAVKKALYFEDGVLKGNTKQADFEIINSNSFAYQTVINAVGSFSSLPVEENALALLALSYDGALASSGKNALITKSKSEGCFPSSYSSECNVKATALAVLALSKFNSSLGKNWLVDAQNNLETGLWSLIVVSNSAASSTFFVNNESKKINLSQGVNSIDLDLKSKSGEVVISINSSFLQSAEIVHTYLGKTKEYIMQSKIGYYTFQLNNEKCFGAEYRSECDADSTAYALLALASNTETKSAIEWLKGNANTTKQKAILNLVSHSSELDSWLENNQNLQGYWSHASLAQSQESDFEASVFALAALKKQKPNSEAISKGVAWINKNIADRSLSEKSLALYLLDLKPEILVSVNPAFFKIKTNSTIAIKISNKGVSDVKISSSFLPFDDKKEITVKKNEAVNIYYSVPSAIKGFLRTTEIEEVVNGKIELKYPPVAGADSEVKYTIPVIILPREDFFVNQTITILPLHFRFYPEKINAVLMKDEASLIRVVLQDLSPYAVKNISFIFSRDLLKRVNITPSYISEIDAGSVNFIDFVFSGYKNYSGNIEARANEVSAFLQINISVTTNSSQVNISQIAFENATEKTCAEQGGEICLEDEQCLTSVFYAKGERCCKGLCEKKPKSMKKLIGFLLLFLALVVIVVFLLVKSKKPKKQMPDVFEEIEKKYSHPSPNLS